MNLELERQGLQKGGGIEKDRYVVAKDKARE